jgi:tetratricopeptide (TPR) repeat protein
VLATLLAYLPALGAGYVWDDDWYLTENPHLRDLAGLARIWIPGNTVQYYPAVFTSFWLEQRAWGLDPAGYHLVNVLLHALNALLVWRLARALCIPGAWLVGALFALHPVHVESVAWITERKNVLSGCFYLAAALAYLRFQGVGAARWRWYAASLGLFALALLSKTVTCSLPVALGLALLWRGERITLRSLSPLAPMLALGLALALHTAYLERTHVGARGIDFDLGLAERLLVAGNALVFYPQKLLLPWPLVFVYPRWELDAGRLASYWPLALVLAVAAAAALFWARGRRAPALALCFYGATIFPALGFVVVYPLRYSFVADHFQYLASLGILALVAGSGASLLTPRSLGAVAAVVLSCLALLTWRQCRLYADAETLWRATLRHNPDAWMAHSNLARLLSERGENDAAREHLETALSAATSPVAAAQIRLNLALTLGMLGRHAEALEHFRELQRTEGGMEVRLAQTLERLGRDEEAESFFRQALENRRDPGARIPFGLHLLRRGRAEEAIVWLELAVEELPDDADALMFLADAYAASGRIEPAIRAAERALGAARASGDARTEGLILRRLEGLRPRGG